MDKYYIAVDDERKGPYALSQLRKMWDSGIITMDTKYTADGMNGWADICELLEDKEDNPLRVADPEKARLQASDHPVQAGSQTPAHETSYLDLDEELFAKDFYVVTRSKFSTPKKTFVIRNITSFELRKEYPWPHVLGLIVYPLSAVWSLIEFLSSKEGWAIFIFWFVLTIFCGFLVKLTCVRIRMLFLTTSDGVVKALTEHDTEYCDEIASALEEAIARH